MKVKNWCVRYFVYKIVTYFLIFVQLIFISYVILKSSVYLFSLGRSAHCYISPVSIIEPVSRVEDVAGKTLHLTLRRTAPVTSCSV